MSDQNPTQGDTESSGRQNIYSGESRGSGKLYSARQAAEMTGYSPVTVRVLHEKLVMQHRIDGRPFFSVDDLTVLHNRRIGEKKRRDPMAEQTHKHRQPMDGRATMWELFQSNRGLIEMHAAVMAQIRDQFWDFQKSMGLIAGDVEKLKEECKKLKKEEKGRGGSTLGGLALLTLEAYGAKAA